MAHIKNRNHSTLSIVAIYAVCGLLWIYLSDTILSWFVHDPKIMVQIAIFKGSLFIFLTSLLLYVLISRSNKRLETLNASLEERTRQAVAELREKERVLMQKYRHAAMGEMINNIAHQWRQPLNSLALVIQEIQFCYDHGQFSEQLLRKNTARSMELINHMSQTIDDFRNFFRDDKEAVVFGVDQAVLQVLSLIEESFKDQNIKIVSRFEGALQATGYPNEYSQVLLNILMNARDALVETHIDGAMISIHAFSEGGKSIVTITDNNEGIAPEIIGKLFEPYFTTKGPDKGTGVGLFMSKTIIEKNMGGRLTVRNTEKGPEFRIEV